MGLVPGCNRPGKMYTFIKSTKELLETSLFFLAPKLLEIMNNNRINVEKKMECACVEKAQRFVSLLWLTDLLQFGNIFYCVHQFAQSSLLYDIAIHRTNIHIQWLFFCSKMYIIIRSTEFNLYIFNFCVKITLLTMLWKRHSAQFTRMNVLFCIFMKM